MDFLWYSKNNSFAKWAFYPLVRRLWPFSGDKIPKTGIQFRGIPVEIGEMVKIRRNYSEKHRNLLEIFLFQGYTSSVNKFGLKTRSTILLY